MAAQATTRLVSWPPSEDDAPLAAAAVAALTVYDMVKSAGQGVQIGPLRLLEKSGGRSGHWRRQGR